MQKMLSEEGSDTDYEKRGYLLEDFRLFHLRDDRGTQVSYHYHEFCKLVFLLSGSGSYVVEGRRYLLKSGDIVFVGSQTVHKPEFPSGAAYERIIIYIDPAFLHTFGTEECRLEECFSGKSGHVLRPSETRARHYLHLLERLEHELSGDEYGRVLLSRSLMLQLLCELGRDLRREGEGLPEPVAARDGKILDILQYIDENLAEDILIEDLSARFFISKYHMMRRFREETGTSIHNYISDKRLLCARDLIRSGASATEACFRSGFRSYSAFSRAYAKLFRTTPAGRSEAEANDDLLDE